MVALSTELRVTTHSLHYPTERLSSSMGRFIAGEACEEREKMRSSRVTTVLRGMDGSLRITIRSNANRSLKLSNPRTMFHTGHSSCKYCVSNAKIWFSSLFSVSFRLLVHQPPYAHCPLCLRHQHFQLVLVRFVPLFFHAVLDSGPLTVSFLFCVSIDGYESIQFKGVVIALFDIGLRTHNGHFQSFLK